MTREVLGARALNRATLARQLLLERSSLGAVAAVEQVAGLQAQYARPMHTGLWTRLEHVDAAHVTALAADRRLVRATMMRHTLHVVSARDLLAWRRVVQPAVTAAFEAMAGRRVGGVDRTRVLEAARERFAQGPATFAEVRELLRERWPDADTAALGYLVRSHLELAQLPSGRGWGWPATPPYVPVATLLGREPDPATDPAPLVRRYLAAYGPASVRDVQTWSGLTGLRAVVERMRDELLTFGDEAGRELFDLPGAPRPDADVPAPPRLLPEFDNLVVAHADRTRLMSDEHRRRISLPGSRVLPSFLVDGRVAGTWAVRRAAALATLTLSPFAPLGAGDRRALVAEAEGMAAFAEPAARDVTVVIAPRRPRAPAR